MSVRVTTPLLQRGGQIAGTYGGAIVRDVFQERSFNESSLIHRQAKADIAAAAAELIPPNATILLDAGTTCLALARAITELGPLTVVTRGLGEPTTEETFVKEQAASRSDRVVLLADASKLGPANVSAWDPPRSVLDAVDRQRRGPHHDQSLCGSRDPASHRWRQR